MPRKIESESKHIVSATIYGRQKEWIKSHPDFNFSGWLREVLDDLIIRNENTELLLKNKEKEDN